MKKRISNIYHCCALETAWLLLSRWIKDPQSFLVCEVATSEAQSCLHGISFCGNRALKIDAIHQCNPPPAFPVFCVIPWRCLVTADTSTSCNHYAPAFKLLVALFTFWWLNWRIFILFHLSTSHYHEWKHWFCPLIWLNLKTRAFFKSMCVQLSVGL